MNRSQPTNSTIYPHGTFRRLAIAVFLGGSVGFTGGVMGIGLGWTLAWLVAIFAGFALAWRAVEWLDAHLTAQIQDVLKFAVLIACVSPLILMRSPI
jgi:hypothetical protein